MRLAFWQHLGSPHQAAFIRELSYRLDHGSVTCVFERSLDPSLRRVGWESDEIDYGRSRIIYADNAWQSVAARLGADGDMVHIFSSLVPHAGIRAAYRQVATRKRTIGLLSEARDWRGWSGALRRADSIRLERAWRNNVSFVLAMGTLGCHWHKICDYEDSRIFEFCYVVERSSEVARSTQTVAPFHAVFVGQLIPRKRVDLLLHAISALRHRSVCLDIAGVGPEENSLRKLVRELRIENTVRFLGGLSNAEVNRLLANADLLVLPSRWDGWGAVINEALCNGARVLCSDFCGAADLVRDSRFGTVFREGSLESLVRTLDSMIGLGKISIEERAFIRDYSASFSGLAVADYLLRVVAWATDCRGERPVAPWRQYPVGVD